MGPLRRDGFLLNAEPLGHVRSFPNSFFPFLSLSLTLDQPANHNFYQSHLRVTIANNHEIARTPFVSAALVTRPILPRVPVTTSTTVFAYIDDIQLRMSPVLGMMSISYVFAHSTAN